MKKYKIAVYTIAKNEEQFVDKWIDSMSEADYICVLDTGSSDKTVEKLRARGVKVEVKEIKPWRFDVARNESMKLIPEDAAIAVSTDLDEVFEKGWAEKLRNAWTDDTDNVLYTYVWSHDSNNNPMLQIQYEKCHKNSKEWSWFMPVHEVLVHKKQNKKYLDLNGKMILHHYPDRNKPRSSYMSLLKLGVEENPTNSLLNYYYGRELYYVERYQDAIKQFDYLLSLDENKIFTSQRGSAYNIRGHCFMKLGKMEEAEASYILSTQYFKGTREPFISLMYLYYSLSRWYSLIDIGQKCLKINHNPAEWYEDMNAYREVPHDYLSIAYSNIADFDRALEHVLITTKYLPNDTRVIANRNYIWSMKFRQGAKFEG
jgi:tetratricopeptide (TPR) repeat protein